MSVAEAVGREDEHRSVVPWPRAPMNQDTAFFWEGAAERELRIQRCVSCGTLRHPARPCCAACLSFEWDYVLSKGVGTVVSFVVYHYPPMPPLEPPYVVALVELEEGTRVVGNVIDCQPTDVAIDAAVEVCFQEVEPGLVLPQWRLGSK